uniref:Uncharacterized protein n=1 Tax=Triticum urartu TaxID=4572 RepID=A0A8R7UFZ2_TRIUA
MHVLSELWLLEPLQGQLPGSQDQLGGAITDRFTRSCLSACLETPEERTDCKLYPV